MILKAISYNIHKGFCARGKRFVLDEIKTALTHYHPDFLLLQEIVGHHTHKKFIKALDEEGEVHDQVKMIAKDLYPYYIYGGNKFHQYGHHGNAIFSKFPLLETKNIDLSINRFERRGLLWAKIGIPNQKPLLILNTHLNLFESGRKKQAKKIIEVVKELNHGHGLLLAGDFNDWRKKMLKYLSDEVGVKEAFFYLNGEYPVSFPSFSPRLSLDRIYYKNLEIVSAEGFKEDPWPSLSDHLPLYLEFRA